MQTFTNKPKAEEKAKSTNKEPSKATKPAAKMTDEEYLLFLQGTAGNRAVQRYLGQGDSPQIFRQPDPDVYTGQNLNGVSVYEPQSSSSGDAPASSTPAPPAPAPAPSPAPAPTNSSPPAGPSPAPRSDGGTNAASQVSVQTPPGVFTGDNLYGVSVFDPNAPNDGMQSSAPQVSVQTPPGVFTGENINGVSVYNPPPPSPKLPDWYNFDKNGFALPGEPLTQAAQTGRQGLLDLLMQRNLQNIQNTSHFASAYSSTFLEVWGNYVGDQMGEAAKAEEKSFWEQLASFVVKASLIALCTVPVLGQLEEAGLAVALIYTEVPKIASEAWESHQEHAAQASKVEQTQGKMVGETAALAGQMQQTLSEALIPLANGYLYTQWLEEAPDEQLNRFRLPPLFPYKTESEIGAAVAQSIAGFLGKDAASKDKSEKEDKGDNLITLDVRGSLAERKIFGSKGPYYQGPEVLEERLNGQPLGEMPDVPLQMNLVVDPTIIEIQPTAEELAAARAGTVSQFFQAFPSKPPMKIRRQPGGKISWSGGGPFEFLFLNVLIDSSINPVGYFSDMDSHIENSIITPQMAVEGFSAVMIPGVEPGIERLFQDQLNPLTVFVNKKGEGEDYSAIDAVVQLPSNEPEQKPAPPPIPDFVNTSPLNALPGEMAPGASAWKPPYTQDYRKFLLDALLLRNEQNSVNGTHFASRYASSFLKMWIDYITDQVVEEVEGDASFINDLITFVVNASITALFTEPFSDELEEAGLAISLIYKNTPQLAGSLTEHYQKGREGDEKSEQIKAGLAGETAAFARQLEETISQAVLPITSGFMYTQWLEQAPLEDLGKFRLPPLIPDKSEGEIDVAVAQAMAGYLSGGEKPEKYGAEAISMGLYLDNPDHVVISEGPYFNGPEALSSRLMGRPIGSAPNIPLYIELSGPVNFYWTRLSEEKGVDPHIMEGVRVIANSWPQYGPVIIQRDRTGKVSFKGGGIGEYFYLYMIANQDPSTNPVEVIKDYAKMIYKPISPEDAAKEMMAQMEPEIPVGIDKLLKDQVARFADIIV